jgi:hypothetical protein
MADNPSSTVDETPISPIRARVNSDLDNKLSQRPDAKDLIDRNILPDSNAAPALQAHQKELEMNMRRNSLETKLQARPKAEELIREGILEGMAHLFFLSFCSLALLCLLDLFSCWSIGWVELTLVENEDPTKE